ncbi:hypothetical protein CGZ92_11515 [Parenemella sanctibonifatiensis]|uniref:Uncharacterized protein n=2 Tax=Parenemella sanctibonifatiensis TaxID=2016505 RepID=A0A255E1I7_9ACTN|nr:hypothetical protein CGZ92_11515 [Parenemella sanctibonifatiensis]
MYVTACPPYTGEISQAIPPVPSEATWYSPEHHWAAWIQDGSVWLRVRTSTGLSIHGSSEQNMRGHAMDEGLSALMDVRGAKLANDELHARIDAARAAAWEPVTIPIDGQPHEFRAHVIGTGAEFSEGPLSCAYAELDQHWVYLGLCGADLAGLDLTGNED